MLEGIIAGLISGILSSIIISVVLFGIKPKVIISKELCRDYSDKNYRVKIVNLSRANLIDVKYTMHYCRRYSDGIGDLQEIEPTKSRLQFIDAYSTSDKYADYAVRITYAIDDTYELADNDCIIFTFYAKHALSGTSIFMTKEYKATDIKCGRFETGKSTKIIVESCNRTFDSCKHNSTSGASNFCSLSK